MNKVPDWQKINDTKILIESRIRQAEADSTADDFNEYQHSYARGQRDVLKVILHSMEQMDAGKTLAEQLIERANELIGD